MVIEASYQVFDYDGFDLRRLVVRMAPNSLSRAGSAHARSHAHIQGTRESYVSERDMDRSEERSMMFLTWGQQHNRLILNTWAS